ncbi:DUF2087 domain-containing protein [Mariniplasma anaerobium]|uniref:DUF2087 domain-containing protein n=1 Tax=Mariniplasma anaerobium TaxID=2735436 RepID=A0A7U9XV32_9MOLU|nr:DUF2087 domain-containing protein [Mariniplasma anaerobium]BCR35854.1 hypothetical protein MPAN_007470 [Mariniplasma anaerobium]
MMKFDISEIDKEEAVKRYVESISPLKLKVFPKKEKQKVILLQLIIQLFDQKMKYNESEINDILKPVYNDYVIIRRYLVDYKFLGRLDNGKLYWVEDRKEI